MFCTFLGEPEFSKHVQEFHRAQNEHYRKGANTCMILLKWKLSLISMHLNSFLDFTKASRMMIRKSLPKNVWKCDKSCVIVTQSQFLLQPGVCFNSKGFVFVTAVLYIQETPMLFQVLIIHMKKLLDSDWLRAVQFKCNTSAKSVTPVQNV